MTQRKGLSAQELISLGEVESSLNPFVRAVREAVPRLEEILSQQSQGRLSLNEPSVRIYRKAITWTADFRAPKGFGYLASSLEPNPEQEVLWTAFVADAFREVNFHPLVIPIDRFYTYYPHQPSLVRKTEWFSDEQAYDPTGRPYALLLSDFSGSSVFNQQTLRDIPTQKNAGFKSLGIPLEQPPEYTDLAQQLHVFTSLKFDRGLWKYLDEEEGDLTKVIDRFTSAVGDDSTQSRADAKLFLATCSLLMDIQMWQNLAYEQKKSGGVPLYIVAPAIFHDAMNRLNHKWGHGIMDYKYRAERAGFKGSDEPLFDVVEGVVKVKGEFTLPDYETLGLTKPEFEQRVGYIAEKLTRNAK